MGRYSYRAKVITDVTAALDRGRHCLILTQWTAHVEAFTDALQGKGFDPVVLRGGMGAKARKSALTRLTPDEGETPLLVVVTGPYVG
jgi:superfamily II DNA/RNA helicase